MSDSINSKCLEELAITAAEYYEMPLAIILSISRDFKDRDAVSIRILTACFGVYLRSKGVCQKDIFLKLEDPNILETEEFVEFIGTLRQKLEDEQ